MKDKISSLITYTEKGLLSFFSALVKVLITVIWTVLWFPVALKQAFNKSYFSEAQRKNVLVRIVENIYWVLRFHRANIFYNLYGLDIKGTKMAPYIDEIGFWRGLNKLNYSYGMNSQICLLRDKFLFYKYMKSNNMPVPEVFAVIRDGHFYDNCLREVSAEFLKKQQGYFIKDVDGECASFVKKIHDFSDLEKYSEKLQKGFYICQNAVKQSEEMNKLNSNAINTLRVITVMKNGKARVLSALLRCGTKETGNVDNWAAGGFAIGINENGFLKKYGLYKPGHGLKSAIHPDSKVVFEEFEIPQLSLAYEIACRAHETLYNIGAIGWDIAITNEGPVFIEGNDNFEITLMQACDRPLKKDWEGLYKNYRKCD